MSISPFSIHLLPGFGLSDRPTLYTSTSLVIIFFLHHVSTRTPWTLRAVSPALALALCTNYAASAVLNRALYASVLPMVHFI